MYLYYNNNEGLGENLVGIDVYVSKFSSLQHSWKYLGIGKHEWAKPMRLFKTLFSFYSVFEPRIFIKIGLTGKLKSDISKTITPVDL